LQLYAARRSSRRASRPGIESVQAEIASSTKFGETAEEGNMKCLLTSSGISNQSISDALVDLLGKPIAESSALFIPTGVYPFPGGAGMAWRASSGKAQIPLCELVWKSLGVLELTALPTIREENWVPIVRDADALLIGCAYGASGWAIGGLTHLPGEVSPVVCCAAVTALVLAGRGGAGLSPGIGDEK
jgi:hypothetical protein